MFVQRQKELSGTQRWIPGTHACNADIPQLSEEMFSMVYC